MSSYESYLECAPKGIQVVREGGHTDVIINGSIFKAFVFAIFALVTGAIGAVVEILTYGAAKNHQCCGDGGCQPCGLGEDMMLFVIMGGLGLLFLLLGVMLIYISFKLALGKTIIRIDVLTGNFSIFEKTPFGEGKHREFLRDKASSYVRQIEHRTRNGATSVYYHFVILPSQEKSKSEDTFIVTHWSAERCEWVNGLICTIQGKSLPTNYY